ncbi:MAG: hypothetical protein HQK54_14210 [Oligoflexales bacterium]|nr:hypothetical protein [Oligoflexales bacterium]
MMRTDPTNNADNIKDSSLKFLLIRVSSTITLMLSGIAAPKAISKIRSRKSTQKALLYNFKY